MLACLLCLKINSGYISNLSLLTLVPNLNLNDSDLIFIMTVIFVWPTWSVDHFRVGLLHILTRCRPAVWHPGSRGHWIHYWERYLKNPLCTCCALRLWFNPGDLCFAAVISTVICDVSDKAQIILDCVNGKGQSVKTIVIMEDFHSDLVTRGKDCGVEILSLKDFEVWVGISIEQWQPITDNLRNTLTLSNLEFVGFFRLCSTCVYSELDYIQAYL